MAWAGVLLSLPTLVSFGAVAVAGGYRFDKLLAFHARRPIQIESGPAAIEFVSMMFGGHADVRFGYGSVNLVSRQGDWLIAGGTIVLAAACLAGAALALRQCAAPERGRGGAADESDASFALLMAAVLAASMALSKVLSPQYFLFLLPVLVVLPTPRDRLAAAANWLLIAAICLLTALIFPWWYRDLIGLRPVAEFMVISRNEMLAMLAVSLAWRARPRRGSLPRRSAHGFIERRATITAAMASVGE